MSYTTTITGSDLTVDLTRSGAQGVGFTWRDEWATATAYSVNDTVATGSNTYVCVVAHTSAALFATDLTAVNWQLMLSNQGDFASAAQ